MGSKSVVVKYVAGVAALVVAVGLFFAAPSYAANKLLISGSGVGPYKVGTTGKQAAHSKLYTKPYKVPGCPTVPPVVKGAAGSAIGVIWSHGKAKDWTPKAKVAQVLVYGAKVGKKRVVTKQGLGVGSTVKQVEARTKHLKRSAFSAKWAPVLSVRSGKGWINFEVQYWDEASGKMITGGWAKLKKQPVVSIVVTKKRLSKVPYGGSGGC